MITRPHLPAASTDPAVPARRAHLADEFMAGMRRLKRRWEHVLPDQLREELGGITIHQLEALTCVATSDVGVTMNDLARLLGAGHSSCTALTDRLVRQGLAERTADASDRRVVRVLPTTRALDLAARFQAGRRATILELFAGLDDVEAEQLVRLIHRLADAGEPL